MEPPHRRPQLSPSAPLRQTRPHGTPGAPSDSGGWDCRCTEGSKQKPLAFSQRRRGSHRPSAAELTCRKSQNAEIPYGLSPRVQRLLYQESPRLPRLTPRVPRTLPPPSTSILFCSQQRVRKANSVGPVCIFLTEQ